MLKGKMFRRQFVISKSKFEYEGFNYLYIGNQLYLSYHQELHIYQGDKGILLGDAFSCTKNDIDLNDNPLLEMKYWAGRWVFICDGRLYLDACGMLGCFYGHDRTGGVVLSSNLEIIKRLTNGRWISNHELVRGEYRGVFDFYPIPFTPIDTVMSLLPSQTYDIFNDKILYRKDINFEESIISDSADILNLFIDGMRNVLLNINKTKSNIWITLTGGVDSRTVLALAYKTKINYKTYTVYRDDIKSWDFKTPLKISKIIHCKHKILPGRRADITDHSRIDDVEEQCGGKTTVGTEVTQYLTGIDVDDPQNSIILWGPGWELCTRYYKPYFKNNCITNDEIIDEYRRVCGNIFEESSVHRKSIVKWLDTFNDYNNYGLDWMERQYWEQREGAWLRYAYQVYDLFDSLRIAPINCQYLLELLISYNHKPEMSEEDVIDKRAEKTIIHMCCPEISKISYGESKSIPHRLLRKCKKIYEKNFGRITKTII